MNLSTSLYARSTRIDYEFNIVTGVHHAWISNPGRSIRTKCAGELYTFLHPYRDGSRDVQRFLRWLIA